MDIKKTFDLAVKNHKENNFQEAEKSYKEILKIKPDHFESIFLLGSLFISTGNFNTSIKLLNQAISIRPNHAQSYNNLGITYKELGDFEKAKNYYQKAINIKPDFADAHNNLGVIFRSLKEFQKAIDCYKKAIKIKSDYTDAHYNLANLLDQINKHDEAIIFYEKAIQINPNYAPAYYNLGNVLTTLGDFKKAITCYQNAIKVKNDYLVAHNNLLFSLLYLDEVDSKFSLSQAKQFRSSLNPIQENLLNKYKFNNNPKKLKIGFVSGDLREHPVGFFLLNTLKHLKDEKIELFAYSNSKKKDNFSTKLKSYFANWRIIEDQSNKDVINEIRNDGIHVLVDLSGHSEKNRLPIFINKPAPIQVTWMSYPATTGIPEIDYIIGDQYVTPKNEQEDFAEKIFELPDIWLCFSSPGTDITISDPPMKKNGYITFGSFNNLLKINNKVISLWSKILKSIPKSKIFLKTHQLDNSYFKAKTIKKFKENGIDESLIILEGSSSRSKLLSSYDKVDIALDPFPYSGGVTSIEAIWMGVPVITKKGFRFISHTTESINHSVGMSDWIANDDDEYIEKCIKFSNNLKSIIDIRKNLRHKALKSPLFNSSLFSKHLSNGFWKMWNNFILKND